MQSKIKQIMIFHLKCLTFNFKTKIILKKKQTDGDDDIW